jgi:hypothetical protein
MDLRDVNIPLECVCAFIWEGPSFKTKEVVYAVRAAADAVIARAMGLELRRR